MAKRKSGIRKHDARVVLSDVLPYELPPTYSNRGFYDFVKSTHLKIGADTVEAQKTDSSTETMLRIVLGRAVSFPPGTATRETVALDLGPNKPKSRKVTIPFHYTVRHRSNDFRTLTIPHPAAQLEIASFYSEYSELILYHTSKSPFSLRHPARVARYTVVRDWLFEANKRSRDSVENDAHEYEWLRSFFTYRRYSNVYKFYDSKEYRSCERRFGYLVKADVAKCFDSIYTHSIAWAAHGHGVIKANIGKNKLARTFGDDFDTLMQRLNHNETSGITIGSETSRIFAEIILQAVDLDIQAQLTAEGLNFGTDYEVLRYVDDYFIFLADARHRGLVMEVLARSLRQYKLHLNAAKEDGEYTPWLSPLTVAKRRVVETLRQTVKRREDDLQDDTLPRPYVDTAGLIVAYKGILLDTQVSHFELANYALSRAERAVEKLIASSQNHLARLPDVSVGERSAHFDRLSSALLGLLDFVFFAYSGAPRMSPAVKVARVTSSLLRFSRQDGVPAHDRERIEMRVRDELLQQLRRAQGDSSPDAVTATLIDCISDLGPKFTLQESELATLCGFVADGADWEPPRTMNALLLFSILLHVKDSASHVRLRRACERWILWIQNRPMHDSERSIVNLNVLTCRYVTRNTRKKILSGYGQAADAVIDQIVERDDHWNVDWLGFDLYAALQGKRLYEVY